MKKFEILVLVLILALAFWVRLYKFHRPIADWHSWRQSDTSAVSRYFVKEGFDVLHPKFDDLSKGVSLIDNPKGYRFVEFPIYNVVQAGMFKLFDKFTLEEWGRIVTIFSCLASIVFLYLLVAKYTNSRTGLTASFFFAIIPFNVYYGRTVLPDQSMVAAILGATFFFSNWIEKPKFSIFNFQFLLTLIFTASALLLKPFALFFTLPMIYLAWHRFGFSFLKKWQLWFFLLLSIMPLLLWRLWMREFPEGIPQSNWLFNGNGIRFKGAFFHWLFADRIGRLILGYWGLPFVVLGIIRKISKKENWFFFFFILSSLLYMTVLATGNIQHDYYQILIIPTLSIFFGKGVNFIFEKKEVFNRFTSYLIIGVGTVFMVAFSWYFIRDYYNLQHVEVFEAGRSIDKILPKTAKVVAPYGGDTTFLYHINRIGWPVFDRTLREFRQAGATHIAFVKPTKEELHFEELFKTVEITDTYAIFDLTQPKPLGLKELKKL